MHNIKTLVYQLRRINVKKIVDTVHITSHKDKTSHEMYGPDLIKKENPDLITMCCEYNFAWLSSYEHILSSLPKTPDHVYLH